MSDRPDWEREGRDWPNRIHSRFVHQGGMRWHVQVAGKGPVLLLLHGTGAATHSWRALLPLLATSFTVVAPDLPGHGFTSRGPQTLPAMAKAVADLLVELDMKPAVVVGHSAGVAVGLRMQLDGLVDVRAMIGLSPALLPFPGLAAKLFPTMAKLLFVNPFAPHIFAKIARGPGEVARFMLRSTGSKIDDAGIDGYAKLFGKPGHIAGTIAMMAAWDLEPLKRDLPGLKVPLLLLHGDGDTAIPLAKAGEAAALVPGARLEVLAGLGHLAHEEMPEPVADMIMVFAKEMVG
jgi:magnesium chelatase accessory protein